MKKICFLVHAGETFHARMFYKDAISLNNAGYEVHICAPNKEKYKKVKNINIWGIYKRKNKWDRLRPLFNLYRIGKRINADAYCCYSPEALIVGVALKKILKVKLLYCALEYYPEANALVSYWLFKPIIYLFFYFLEWYLCKSVEYVFSAHKYLCQRYRRWTNTIWIASFPSLNIIKKWNTQIKNNRINTEKLIYIGGIHPVKGIFEMIETMFYLKYKYPTLKLCIIGYFYSSNIKIEVKKRINKLKLTKKIVFIGKIPNPEFGKYISGKDIAGLKLDHPKSKNIHVIGDKFFEYAGMGMPVVASNVPATKEIIDKYKCGLLVNSKDPKDIAKAIIYLLENPNVAKEMGERGKKAVFTKYNWEKESKKMIQVYKKLFNKS